MYTEHIKQGLLAEVRLSMDGDDRVSLTPAVPRGPQYHGIGIIEKPLSVPPGWRLYSTMGEVCVSACECLCVCTCMEGETGWRVDHI